MIYLTMLLNELKLADIVFFIVLASIIGVFVLVYLLTPLVKRKQFAKARENLKKREETFRKNLSKLDAKAVQQLEELDKKNNEDAV